MNQITKYWFCDARQFVCLLFQSPVIDDVIKFSLDDEKIGYKILTAALDIPLRLIANNAGASADVVVETVKSEKDSYGYDALLNTYTDMFKSGIVDPAKVTRSALENAASIAAMLLTTEAAVVEIPEEKGYKL